MFNRRVLRKNLLRDGFLKIQQTCLRSAMDFLDLSLRPLVAPSQSGAELPPWEMTSQCPLQGNKHKDVPK